MQKGGVCLSCPLRDAVYVPPEGSKGAEIVIVGEAPGAEEEKIGRPFVGPSGQLLRRVLGEVGLDSGRVYITNVVKCRPPGNELRAEMVKCCSLRVEMELASIGRPRLIVALGRTAKEFFRIPGAMEDVRGKIFDTKYGKVLVELHPAYLLRNAGVDRLWKATSVVYFLRSMMLASRFIQLGRSYKEVPYEIVDTWGKAQRVLERIDGRVCGFDFETYGVDPWKVDFKVLTCALSLGEEGSWVVDFSGWDGAREFIQKAYQVSRPVFFNAPFDVAVGVKECGWGVKDVDDLQVIAYLLNGGSEKAISLKRLALDWTDVGDYGIDVKKPEEILRIPRERLYQYNATDAYVTAKLFEPFKERLKDDLEWSVLFGKEKKDLLWCYENVLKKLLVMAIELRVNGMVVDTEYLRSLEQELLQRKREIERAVGAGVNLNSPQQVLKWLRSRGIQVESTRKEVLEKLLNGAEGSEIAELKMLMDYRTIEKLLNTYVVPLRLEHLGSDGCVHANFSLVKTATGRLSCSEPNLMNIPTRLGPIIEKAFVSRFGDGGVIVKADFSQHELRVACQYSKDRKMKEFFESGVDIHTKVAMEIYGLKEEELGTEREKQLRRIAKGFNFGVIYGRGAGSIAQELGISEEEGRRMIEDYFKMFSGLKRWLDGVKEFVRRYGFVRNMFGRVRWIGLSDEEGWAQKAVNTPVQGLASDIAGLVTYSVMKRIKDSGLRAKVVNFIHDALLVDCPVEEVDAVKSIIFNEVRRVELPEEKFVEFEVEVNVGKSWGEMKEQ